MTTLPRRFALVGCGRIGAPVLAACQASALRGWELTGVLVRTLDGRSGPLFTNELSVLLGGRPELIVEVAGPSALAMLGEALLRAAEVWTVSAVALADAALTARLEACGQAAGHHLRVLPGAFAGLDGVATLAAAPQAALDLDIDLPPGPAPAEDRFSGSVREAAKRFPDAVNVAVAAALAGPGLDATRVRVRHPGPVPRHRLALRAQGAAGSVEVGVWPQLAPGVHPVACNVVAALRRELQVIQVG
jgi:aspartate dehydrogenase